MFPAAPQGGRETSSDWKATEMDQSEGTPASPGREASEDQVKRFIAEIYPHSPGTPATDQNLIGLLQQTQENFGYLPALALQEISRLTRTPLSRIYGVVSFYAQFYTTPRGRHTIRACRGTACHVRGGKKVIQAIRNILGIDDGQTTEDMMFSFETVACLGTCFLAPTMMIDNQYFGKLTPQRVESILKSYQAGGS